MNFTSIFIVTYGRSGSTLLQGLLNGIDGMLIRGENNNFIFHLFEAYEQLNEAIDKYGTNNIPKTPTSPWFGIDVIDQNLFLCDLRKSVTRILMSDRAGDASVKCIGFKEIRYPQIEENLGAYLNFLSQLFPNSGFVVLTRDLDEVKLSAWWAYEDPTWVKDYLDVCEHRIMMHAKNRKDFFFLDHTDVLAANQKLRDLFTFLGAPFIEEDVRRILSVPHSYVATLK